MAIPNYQEIMLPLLKFAGSGQEIWIQDCFDVLADGFGLSEVERNTIRRKNETIFSNRVRWAKAYLSQAGLLESTKRGHFKITATGLSILKQAPTKIDNKFLRQFPAFIEFLERSTKKEDEVSQGKQDEEAALVDEQTPEDQIFSAFSTINETLKSSLLEQVHKGSPAFFEKLILDLMLAMGYGGDWQDAASRVGKTGDGGIDGIINEDVLGLDVIYLQAKRYQPDTTISSEVIRGFSGALTGKGATKGVFVATCKFSPSAREFATTNKLQKIVLIDGQDLARLMIQYGIGVSLKDRIELKQIDSDYFEGGDLV